MAQTSDMSNAERLDVRALVMADYDRGIKALADIRDNLAREDGANIGRGLSTVRAAIEAWDGSDDLWVGGQVGRLDADVARSIALVQTAIRFTDMMAQQSDELRMRLEASRSLDPGTSARSSAIREIHSETLAYAAAVGVYAQTRGEGMPQAWLAAIPESFKEASVKYRAFVEGTDRFMNVFGAAISDRPLSPYYPPIAEGVSDPVVLAHSVKAIAEAVVRDRLKEIAFERDREAREQSDRIEAWKEQTANTNGVPWMAAGEVTSQTAFEVDCEIAGEIASSLRQTGVYVQPGWSTSFAIQAAECSNGDRKFVATARMEGEVEVVDECPVAQAAEFATEAVSLDEARKEAEAIRLRLWSEGAKDVEWKASVTMDSEKGTERFSLKFTFKVNKPFPDLATVEKAADAFRERFASTEAGEGAKHVDVETFLDAGRHRIRIVYPPVSEHLRTGDGSIRLFDTHEQAVEAMTKRLAASVGDLNGMDGAICGFFNGHEALTIPLFATIPADGPDGPGTEIGYVDRIVTIGYAEADSMDTQTPGMQRGTFEAHQILDKAAHQFLDYANDHQWEEDDCGEYDFQHAKALAATHFEIVEERIVRGAHPLSLIVEHEGRQVPAKAWLDVSDNGRSSALVAAVQDEDGVWKYLKSENGGALTDTGLRSALVDVLSLKAVARGRDQPETNPYRLVTEADMQAALAGRDAWLSVLAGHELPAARIAEIAVSRAGRSEFPVNTLAASLREAENVVAGVRDEARERGGRFMAALLAAPGKAITPTTADTFVKSQAGTTVQTVASVHRGLIRAVTSEIRSDIADAVAAVIRVEAAREERDGQGFRKVIDDKTNSQGLDNIKEAVDIAGIAEIRTDHIRANDTNIMVPYELPGKCSPLKDAEVVVHWRHIEREADRLRDLHGLNVSEAVLAAITDGDRIRNSQTPDAGVLASLDPQVTLRSVSQAVARVNGSLSEVGLQPRHIVAPVSDITSSSDLALLAALQARHLSSGRLGHPGAIATIGGEMVSVVPETRRALIGEMNRVAERNLQRDNPPVIRGQRAEWSPLQSAVLKAASIQVLGRNASAINEHFAIKRLDSVWSLHSIVTNAGRTPLPGPLEAIAGSAQAAHTSLEQARLDRGATQESRRTISR